MNQAQDRTRRAVTTCLWNVWNKSSAAFSMPGNLAVHLNCANIHNRFVSLESCLESWNPSSAVETLRLGNHAAWRDKVEAIEHAKIIRIRGEE